MEQIKVDPNATVVKPLEGEGSPAGQNMLMNKKAVLVYILMIVAGLLVGGGVYAWKNQGKVQYAGTNVEVVKTPTEEGIKDAASFKDTATGKLIVNDGKITQEGTHILTRGDVSQNVFLTSTVVDLSKYEGKNVQVWGETYSGQKAGWLMDVGRIKIVE